MTRENWYIISCCAVLSLFSYCMFERDPGLRQVQDVWKRIDRNYVEPIDSKKLSLAAINSVIDELDPHSLFTVPEKSTKLLEQLDGSFGGIGIESWSDQDQQRLFVQYPLPDGPAAKAGLSVGDEIVAVNGTTVKTLGLKKSLDQIRGPLGTTVKLTVQPIDLQVKPKEVEITRQQIVEHSIVGYQRDAKEQWQYTILTAAPELGYVRITQFFKDTTIQELQLVLEQLKQQNVQGLILDLRGNPGGLLPDAVKICDLFVSSGLLASTRGRMAEVNREYQATSGNEILTCPMVILINEDSASASELLAAVLQDHQRATIVGQRSYGKGSVQHVMQLPSRGEQMVAGNEQASEQAPYLKLTVAYYYPPSGRNIHRKPNMTESDEWGVTPAPENRIPLNDEQLEALLLWQRLREHHGQALELQTPEKSETVEPGEPRLMIKQQELGSPLDESCPDPQLRRAIQILQPTAK